MMKRPPSFYDKIQEQLKRPAVDVASDQQALDALDATLKRFHASAHAGYSNAEKSERKTAILGMVQSFDARTPDALEDLHTIGKSGEVRPIKGRITGLLEKLQATQQHYHEETDPQKQQSIYLDSARQVRKLGDALDACREFVQPKRPPRIDPTRDKVLKGITMKDVEDFSKFARAFAASVEADRAHDGHRRTLDRLPAINQLADESIMFTAMLDLAQAIDSAIRQGERYGNARAYWQAHQESWRKILADAHDDFTAKIVALHPRVTAGYRGLATMRSYEEYVKADQSIHAFTTTEKATDAAQVIALLTNARDTLKHQALELLIGGTNEDRSQTHHNFLTRVVRAYEKDRETIAREADAHAAQCIHQMDHYNMSGSPYDSPLTGHALHTLNRVYEARWAMTAQDLAKLIGRSTVKEGNFRLTIVDPKVAIGMIRREPVAARVHSPTCRGTAEEHITALNELLKGDGKGRRN